MTIAPQAGRPRISPLGFLFLGITSVGWGLNFPIMKNLLTEWPPLSSRGLCGAGDAAQPARRQRRPLRQQVLHDREVEAPAHRGNAEKQESERRDPGTTRLGRNSHERENPKRRHTAKILFDRT